MPARDIGRLGIWTFQLDLVPSKQAQEHVTELEEPSKVIAALGPRMWPLAAERTARAHRCFVLPEHTSLYVGLPNDANNLKRFGFVEEDFADQGSDKLIDAIVAAGTIETVIERVQAHHDAGADLVGVQVIAENNLAVPAPEWRELAPALW